MEYIRKKLDQLGYHRLFPDQQLLPDEQRVRELEAEIGSRLPDDYRSFLLEFGSIAPSIPVEVPMPNRDDDYFAVCSFLGFYSPNPNPNLLGLDLLHVYRATRRRIGSFMLPVAKGEGGALLCLCVICNDYQCGSIWAWASELDDEEEWKLYPLADSVDDLIRKLRAFEDPFAGGGG